MSAANIIGPIGIPLDILASKATGQKSIILPPLDGTLQVIDRSLKFITWSRGTNFNESIEILRTGVPLCATCQQRCGCTGCIIGFPCNCTLGYCTSCFSKPCKCCNKCMRYPCNCIPPVCSQCKTYPCMHITGFSSPLFSGQNVRLLNSNATNNVANLTFASGGSNYNMNISGPGINQQTLQQGLVQAGLAQPQPAPSPSLSLSTGPQYYNPNMLQRGTTDEKSARQRAIEFRNLMLGEKWKDLYSPHGFIVDSKVYLNIRRYVFYSHHVSCHVFDNDVNIGRLDVHVDGYNVPMGDTHIAAILKCINDEKDFLRISHFSPVRDI